MKIGQSGVPAAPSDVRPASSPTAHSKSRHHAPVPSIYDSQYSPDGTGNNLDQPNLGSANTDLIRIAGTAYGDGVSSMAGADRPNPRAISNLLATQLVDPETNNRGLSDMIYAWGQFIDHDLDLTPSGTTESAPIQIPDGDPVFTPGTQMPFGRAVTDPATGTDKSNPRQQPNTITSFLDSSQVYGSDPARADALRTHTGGQMKTSAGDLLPINTDGLPVGVDIPGVDPKTLYLAGDVRVNENSELSSMSTLFVREHNHWAQQLATEHPDWSDEQLYQGARQIVIAEMQNITYKEFLPALLGPNAVKPYEGYDPTVNPSVSAEFSAAAYRVGHSQVNANIDFLNNDGSESHDPVDFNVSADNPAILQGGPDWKGAGVDNALKYLTADNAQEVDNHFENTLRNQLFAPSQPGQGGLDLYAIDVQRGRDVGLPDYNSVRASYGLPKVTSFSQITSNPTLQAQLQQLYGTVDNIDLFVGGLSEDHLNGSSVGPTFSAIIADQFERTRDGDRNWYQRIFSGSDLKAIENTTLSDIIKRNTSVTNLQDNVFQFTPGTISGKVVLDEAQGGKRQPGLKGEVVQLTDAAGNKVAQTVSAKDGSYKFDHLQQGGTYQVQVISQDPELQSEGPKSVTLANTDNAGQFNVDLGMDFVNWDSPKF